MACAAYADSRQYMWLNIGHTLAVDLLFNEWRCIHNAPVADQFRYLLGYYKADWDSQCAVTLDRFVRLYILSAAAKRKARLSLHRCMPRSHLLIPAELMPARAPPVHLFPLQ